MFLKNIVHYSVYRNMLVYFILLVALVVLILSVTLFSFFSKSTTDEISNISKSMLTQTSYTSSLIHDQVLYVGNQLLNDSSILTVMLEKQDDRIREYDAILTLGKIQGVYPFIKYIGIYNDYTKRYTNTKDLAYELEEDLQIWLEQPMNNSYIEMSPRTVTASHSPEKPFNVLTFMLFPHYSFPPKGAMVINVDESYILNLIRGMRNNRNDDIFVMNAEGIILSHTNSELFNVDFSKYPYIQNILDSTESTGHFIKTIDHKEQLITYVKSENLNWFFVSITPYKELISNITQLRQVTLYIASGMMLVGILLALWITNNLYNPLGNLITKINKINKINKIDSTSKHKNDEYNFLSTTFTEVINKANVMQNQVETSMPILKQTYLRSLLQGTLNDITNNHVIEAIQKQLKGPYFCVFVIKIDEYKPFQKNNTIEDQALSRFAICNISQELMERHNVNDPFITEEDEITIITQIHNNILTTDILLTLREIQEVINNYFKLSISIGIGHIIPSKDKISHSYDTAKECINYRLFYGKNSVIEYNDIKERTQQTFKYPLAFDKRIVEAIQLNNRPAIEKEIKYFITAIRPMSYHHALTYANQLIVTVLKYFDPTIGTMNEASKEFYSLVRDLPQFETLEEISTALCNFCFKICEGIEKNNSEKNREVIEQIQKYINKHYHKPDLTLDTLADLVNLSSGYLGKLFRTYCGKSFNDYLKEVRLEKSKELLIHTNDSISTISEKVGIYNTSYFPTQFKKTYGISPSKFRSDHSSDQLDDK